MIAFDAVGSGELQGSPLTYSHVLGGGANRIVVVGVTMEGDNDPADVISSVTYNGVAMTEATSITSDGADYRETAKIFYLLDASLPVAGTYNVVITHDGFGVTSGATSFTGVVQVAPEAVATSNVETANGEIAVAITTLTADAWIIDVVGIELDGTFTSGGSQTERWDKAQTVAFLYTGAGSTRVTTAPGLYTNTWDHSASFASFKMVAAAVSIAPLVSDLVSKNMHLKQGFQ